MKVLLYKCDECKNVLSNQKEKIAVPHLSIDFGEFTSGWVKREKNTWKFQKWLQGIKHFCNSRCLAKYVRKVIDGENETN